ncbi:unnamed protein product [Dovyalis caffra]|uniref:Uncharacterized protein n=1 Tax=Dovyalis caffra TaxID=77055 RepID=A0AAV1RF76_9ROSI|nr:unnamed protein product [Dovyalis caffra]
MNSISQSSSSATPVNLTEMVYSLFEAYSLTGHHARIEHVFIKLDTLFQQVIDDHLKAWRTEEKEDIIDGRHQTESSATQLTKDNIEAVILMVLPDISLA